MNRKIKKTLYSLLPLLMIILCVGMVSYIFAATSSTLQMDNIIAYELPVGSGTKDDPYLIYRVGANDGTAEAGSFNFYAGKNSTNTNYFSSTNQYYFKQVYDLTGSSITTVNLLGFYDGNFRTFTTTGAGRIFNNIGSSSYKTAKLSNLNVVNTNSVDAGGIATSLYGTIDCCTFSGKITSTADVGGFVSSTNAGATISNSYNSANISTSTTSAVFAGGFVGVATATTTITNCYNTGKITGKTAGGLLGKAFANILTMTNCYNYGTVSGTTKGSLVGNCTALTVSNSYWNASCGASYACPSSTSTAAGSSRSIAQMQYQSSYTNWSFGTYGTATSGWCFVPASVTVDGTSKKLILPRLWFEELTTYSTYTITFNKGTGTGTMASQLAIRGEAVTLVPVAFTAPTYQVFSGWSKTSGGAVAYANGATFTPTANTPLYAIWSYQTYSVTLDQQNGTGGTESITATYGLAMPSGKTAPTRTGYTFGGYYTGTNGTGTQYYTAAMASAKNWDKTATTTLYAKWTPIQYTVRYHLNYTGASPSYFDVTCNYGTTYNYKTAANFGYTRTGYTLSSFKSSASSGTSYSLGASFSNLTSTAGGTINRYAQWTANTYTVTLDQQSGSGGTTSVTATYNSAMPSGKTAPTRTGYTFGGYYTSTGGSGTQYYTAAMASAKNWDKTAATTLYAKWTPITYTVRYYRNSTSSDSTYTDVTCTYGVSYTYPTASNFSYTKTGYHLTSFKSARSSGTSYSLGTSFSNLSSTAGTVISRYAQWTVNTYTVRYHLNYSGASPSYFDVTCNYGTTYYYKTASNFGYTRSGYELSSFKSAASSGTTYSLGASFSNLTTTNGGTVHRYAQWIQVYECLCGHCTATVYSQGDVCPDCSTWMCPSCGWCYVCEEWLCDSCSRCDGGCSTPCSDCGNLCTDCCPGHYGCPCCGNIVYNEGDYCNQCSYCDCCGGCWNHCSCTSSKCSNCGLCENCCGCEECVCCGAKISSGNYCDDCAYCDCCGGCRNPSHGCGCAVATCGLCGSCYNCCTGHDCWCCGEGGLVDTETCGNCSSSGGCDNCPRCYECCDCEPCFCNCGNHLDAGYGGYLCGRPCCNPVCWECNLCNVCAGGYCDNCQKCTSCCTCTYGNCDCCGTYAAIEWNDAAGGYSGGGYYCSSCHGTGWCYSCGCCGACHSCSGSIVTALQDSDDKKIVIASVRTSYTTGKYEKPTRLIKKYDIILEEGSSTISGNKKYLI